VTPVREWPQQILELATANPSETSFMRYFASRRGDAPSPSVLSAWTPLAEISPLFVAAVIKAEDPHFFSHRGVNWRVTARKTCRALCGRFAGGGSTITQQLARNLYLTPSRSVQRKLREIRLALRIERAVSKARILELYLNVIQFGATLWGCTAASQHYFGKAPADLDLFESTALAVLLPAPSAGLGGAQARRCRRSQRLLVSQLFLSGFVSAEACAASCERVAHVHRLLGRGIEVRTALSSPHVDGTEHVPFLRELASALAIAPIPLSEVLTARCGYEQERRARKQLRAWFGVESVAWLLEQRALDPTREPMAAHARGGGARLSRAFRQGCRDCT
jgi:monofunctional biosynthetic peptidoglycan transglycosylase